MAKTTVASKMGPWSPDLFLTFPFTQSLQLPFTKMQALNRLIRNNEEEKS